MSRCTFRVISEFPPSHGGMSVMFVPSCVFLPTQAVFHLLAGLILARVRRGGLTLRPALPELTAYHIQIAVIGVYRRRSWATRRSIDHDGPLDHLSSRTEGP